MSKRAFRVVGYSAISGAVALVLIDWISSNLLLAALVAIVVFTLVLFALDAATAGQR